jgi:hypothetical protein
MRLISKITIVSDTRELFLRAIILLQTVIELLASSDVPYRASALVMQIAVSVVNDLIGMCNTNLCGKMPADRVGVFY